MADVDEDAEELMELDAIDEALKLFTTLMRARLHEKVYAGYRGWNDQSLFDDMEQALITTTLYHHFGVEDNNRELDIANYAMFLFNLRINKEPPL